MTMRRRLIALGVAVLFIAPASAVAECAWVRWQRTVDRNGAPAWDPLSGSSQMGCERSRDAYLAADAERQVHTFTQVGIDTTLWTVMKKDDADTPVIGKMYEYRCLPDTVD